MCTFYYIVAQMVHENVHVADREMSQVPKDKKTGFLQLTTLLFKLTGNNHSLSLPQTCLSS